MNDYTKTKIGFAVALLAVMFTASPLVVSVAGNGFDLFGYSIAVIDIYSLTAIALSVAVYFYGLHLLLQRPMQVFQSIADTSYGVALVVPPFAFALYIAVEFATWLGHVAQSPLVGDVLKVLLSAVSGALSAIGASRAAKMLNRRSIEAETSRLEDEEIRFFTRAKELLAYGNYDLAVVEAFKSIEVAARRRLTAMGRLIYGPRVESPVQAALREKLIPHDLHESLQQVRQYRNLAAHGVEPMGRAQAEFVIEVASKVLQHLTEQHDEPAVAGGGHGV